ALSDANTHQNRCKNDTECHDCAFHIDSPWKGHAVPSCFCRDVWAYRVRFICLSTSRGPVNESLYRLLMQLCRSSEPISQRCSGLIYKCGIIRENTTPDENFLKEAA